MGIYDRPYYQNDSEPNLAPSWSQRSAIALLIISNVVIAAVHLLLRRKVPGVEFGDPVNKWADPVVDWLALQADQWFHYSTLWRVFTYGFVHDANEIWHILLNMLGLWMLGRAVEDRYGRSEFLRIYCSCIVLCGLAWLGFHHGDRTYLIGASGAVTCIEMLFILNFPRTILMLFGVAPIPAWVLGVFLILSNMVSGQRLGGVQIAYDVHLVGIAYAFAYFFLGWNFAGLANFLPWLRRTRRRLVGPRLRVHTGQPNGPSRSDEAEADRILQKIHEKGQESLTAAERRFMEKYSRRVRQRREFEES